MANEVHSEGCVRHMKIFLRMVMVGLLFVSWSGGAVAEEWKRVTFSKGDVTVSFEVPLDLVLQSEGALGETGYVYALRGLKGDKNGAVIFYEVKELNPFESPYQLDWMPEKEKETFLTTLNQRMRKGNSTPFRYVTLKNGHQAAFQSLDYGERFKGEQIVIIAYPYKIVLHVRMSSEKSNLANFKRFWDSLQI